MSEHWPAPSVTEKAPIPVPIRDRIATRLQNLLPKKPETPTYRKLFEKFTQLTTPKTNKEVLVAPEINRREVAQSILAALAEPDSHAKTQGLWTIEYALKEADPETVTEITKRIVQSTDSELVTHNLINLSFLDQDQLATSYLLVLQKFETEKHNLRWLFPKANFANVLARVRKANPQLPLDAFVNQLPIDSVVALFKEGVFLNSSYSCNLSNMSRDDIHKILQAALESNSLTALDGKTFGFAEVTAFALTQLSQPGGVENIAEHVGFYLNSYMNPHDVIALGLNPIQMVRISHAVALNAEYDAAAGIPLSKIVHYWLQGNEKTTYEEKVGQWDVNIERIQQLEEIPGSTARLNREFGICIPGRYPIENLRKQLEPIDPDQPFGFWASARKDESAALYTEQGMITSLNANLPTAQPIVFECSSPREIIQKMLRIRSLRNRSGAYIVAVGHGNPESLSLDYGKDLTKEAVDQLNTTEANIPDRILESEAQIVLISCSTGTEEGIAKNIAQGFQRETTAPSGNTGVQGLAATEYGDGHVQISIRYNEGISANVFKAE